MAAPPSAEMVLPTSRIGQLFQRLVISRMKAFLATSRGKYFWPPSKTSAPIYGCGWATLFFGMYFGFIRTGKSKWAEWENKRKREYAAASLQVRSLRLILRAPLASAEFFACPACILVGMLPVCRPSSNTKRSARLRSKPRQRRMTTQLSPRKMTVQQPQLVRIVRRKSSRQTVAIRK